MPPKKMQDKGNIDVADATVLPFEMTCESCLQSRCADVSYSDEVANETRNRRILLFQCHAYEDGCRERLQILRHFNPELPIHILYGGESSDVLKFHRMADGFEAGFLAYPNNGRDVRWK